MDIIAKLAEELSLGTEQVKSTVELIDGGNTIPFIARYRKEVTGSLDDEKLRDLSERLTYLRNLEARKAEVHARSRTSTVRSVRREKRVRPLHASAGSSRSPRQYSRRSHHILLRSTSLPRRSLIQKRALRVPRMHLTARATSSPRISPTTPITASLFAD